MLFTAGTTFGQSPLTTPEALWMKPIPNWCLSQQLMGIGIVQARDDGLSEKEAVERVTSQFPLQRDKVPGIAAAAFRHKQLSTRDVDRYMMFSCHARSYNLPALSLDDAAKDLIECGEKLSRDPCVVEVRNIITGAPRDYRPPSRTVPTIVPGKRADQP
jgi:hypothetical protein